MKASGTIQERALLNAHSLSSVNEPSHLGKSMACNGTGIGRKARVVFIEVAASDVAAVCGSLANEVCQVTTVDDAEQAVLTIAAAVPDLVVYRSEAWRHCGEHAADALTNAAMQRPLLVLLIPTPAPSTPPQKGGLRLASPSSPNPSKHRQVLQSIRSIIALVARSRRSDSREQLVSRGDIALDLITHRGTRGRHPLHLSQTTFHLLRLLMEEPDRVFSREQLLRSLRGDQIHLAIRTIDAHVRRLRKELNVFGGPDVIRTVRGVGYAFSHDKVWTG